MQATYEDILRSLCSRSTLLNVNDAQYIFSLSTAQEAQLAYDIFAAYGFDVRIYHEPDASKFYISRAHTVDHSSSFLNEMMSHSRMLKHILANIQTYTQNDYKIAFANTPNHGRKITIHFAPDPTMAAHHKDPIDIPVPRPNIAPAFTPQKPPVTTPTTHINLNTTATQLAKHHLFNIRKKNKKKTLDNPLNLQKRISIYIFGNITEAGYVFFVMGFLLLVFLSAAIIFRGFACPDVVFFKNDAWYCRNHR